MNTTEAKNKITSGDVPVALLWNGAELILNAIILLFSKRVMLRQRVDELEKVDTVQAKQILYLENRIKALEALNQ